jgi:hypothetical protein
MYRQDVVITHENLFIPSPILESNIFCLFITNESIGISKSIARLKNVGLIDSSGKKLEKHLLQDSYNLG